MPKKSGHHDVVMAPRRRPRVYLVFSNPASKIAKIPFTTSWWDHHIVVVGNPTFLNTRKSPEIVCSFQIILNLLNRSYES